MQTATKTRRRTNKAMGREAAEAIAEIDRLSVFLAWDSRWWAPLHAEATSEALSTLQSAVMRLKRIGQS